MSEQREQRIVRNESVLREVNEAIRGGRWPGEEGAPAAFRCECGLLGCNRLIEITAGEYERIRAHPRHFLVAVDHETAAVEAVVETHARYLVVEKEGQAGRLADMTDPRT